MHVVEDSWTRALDKVVRLAAEPRDLVGFWTEVNDVLVGRVPHFGLPCWYTVDPASLLITSHFNPQMPSLPAEMLAMEYRSDDVNAVVDVARSASGISTIHDATDGDPSGSPRWQANMEHGGDQELVLALRSPNREVWGTLGLYREPGRPLFDDSEKRWLVSLAPHLAEGARRSLLVGEARDPEGSAAPGLVVLTEQLEVESETPGVRQWLADLPDGDDDRLPSAVLTVAGRALRTAVDGQRPAEPAMARVLCRSGTWVVLHGAVLRSGAAPRVAVIVEPAHPARITSLLMSAYGLSARERDVTTQVLQGASTTDVAHALHVSPHTVQQHLKSIFDKTGVRSRRDLVATVFLTHYEPRVRDNERRALADKPLRGGPALS